MIKLQAKRFELNFLLKFSDLKSNFTLTLGYLNPALNNRGQEAILLDEAMDNVRHETPKNQHGSGGCRISDETKQ